MATDRAWDPSRGVISPLLSNILLTPFDREMRRWGYELTRYADDWVVTCRSLAEAKAALAAARRVLEKLGVELHSRKTRIVHIREGFEFLGYKIKRGTRPLKLAVHQIRSGARSGGLYAYPREKSIQHFKDQMRQLTRRRASVSTQELIEEITPILRGWVNYFRIGHSSRCFGYVKDWVEKKIRRHLMRARKRKGFGWNRWSRDWLYRRLGLYGDYQVRYYQGPKVLPVR